MPHQQHTRKKQEAPLQCPWLLFETVVRENGRIWCFSSSVPCQCWFTRFPPHGVRIVKVLNCCFGWLIFSSEEDGFFIWNPVKSRLVQLPPLNHLKEDQMIRHAILSSPPVIGCDYLDPNCMIMLFQGNSCIHYCLLKDKDKHWNTVCYGKRRDSNSFENPVLWNDSIYVEDRIGREIVCITDVSPTAIVTRRYCKIPQSLLPGKYEFEGTGGGMVKSCGELFYIVIKVAGFLRKDISKVEAFKLDRVGMIWNKMTNMELEGHVFFFNQTYSVSSYHPKGDGFLFYTSRKHSDLLSYCFADTSISTCSLLHSFYSSSLSTPSKLFSFFRISTPILYLADARLTDDESLVQLSLLETRVDLSKIREEADSVKIYEEKNRGGEGGLYCIPSDVIKFVTSVLDPVDYLNFRSVSRTCRSLAPQIEWRKVGMTYAPTLSPWFMSTDNHSSIYNFVDTKLGGMYFVNIPESLVDSRIIHSNNGWLLMIKSRKACFYNPFKTEIIKLPNTCEDFSDGYSSVGFSSSPTCSKCFVVAIGKRLIHIFRVGSKKWHTCRVSYLSQASTYSPVFHDGSFYVLGLFGSLGVFKVEDGDGDGGEPLMMSWKVVDMKTRFLWLFSSLQVFLLECDGNLLLVRTDQVGGRLVEVFALNKTTMSWQKKTDLGNHNLYLCKSSSFSKPVCTEWMRNTIFFPRVHEESLVYYSMDTKKYHTLANKAEDTVDYNNTRELLLASWIQPSWS